MNNYVLKLIIKFNFIQNIVFPVLNRVSRIFIVSLITYIYLILHYKCTLPENKFHIHILTGNSRISLAFRITMACLNARALSKRAFGLFTLCLPFFRNNRNIDYQFNNYK